MTRPGFRAIADALAVRRRRIRDDEARALLSWVTREADTPRNGVDADVSEGTRLTFDMVKTILITGDLPLSHRPSSWTSPAVDDGFRRGWLDALTEVRGTIATSYVPKSLPRTILHAEPVQSFRATDAELARRWGAFATLMGVVTGAPTPEVVAATYERVRLLTGQRPPSGVSATPGWQDMLWRVHDALAGKWVSTALIRPDGADAARRRGQREAMATIGRFMVEVCPAP